MTQQAYETYKNGRPTKAALLHMAQNCAQADIEGDVYIIEFSAPIGNLSNPKGACGMYVGWALKGEAYRRLDEHRAGKGARVTAAAADAGIEMNIVAILPGTVVTERQIKNLGNTPKFIAKLRAENSPFLVQKDN